MAKGLPLPAPVPRGRLLVAVTSTRSPVHHRSLGAAVWTCGWAAPLPGQAASSAPIRGSRAAAARLEEATGPGIPALREDRCEGCLQAVLRGTLRRPAAAQVPQRDAWCRGKCLQPYEVKRCRAIFFFFF